MSYAEHRTIIDVDSHVIELDAFLSNVALPDDAPLNPDVTEQTELPYVKAWADRGRSLLEKRQSDPETMAKFEASLTDARKGGFTRLGAFDPEERSHALDLLGFKSQWVLPTFSFHQIAHVDNLDQLEAGARTLNCAMGTFCAHDDRLRAIGYIPLTLGPAISLQLMRQGFKDGCYSFMVDTNEPDPKKISFTHLDFDPVWAEFASHNAPFVTHVAVNGHYDRIPRSFRRNGRGTLELGGDAPAREIGMVTIKNSVEIFLSAMIFDEVFERHPYLRGISMEHAAFWIPSWMHALDFAAANYKHQRKFQRLPSETVRKHLRFSPFAGEPVGWIIENVGPEILVFASDYTHPEGTSDPIGKFEASMTNCDQATMDAFYHGNMEALMGVSA